MKYTRSAKTAVLWGVLALATLVPVFAQEEEAGAETEAGTEEKEFKDKRLEVYLVLDADAFRVTSHTYGASDIRYPTGSFPGKDYVETQLPLSNIVYYKDSYMYVQYNANNYGGRFKLTLGDDMLPKGGVNGWVKFGFFKVAVGNDNDAKYADSLGADPELRLYTGKTKISVAPGVGSTTWKDATKNPDNITGGEGVLVEGDFNPRIPLTVSLAAGNFSNLITNNSWLGFIKNTNDYVLSEERRFSYGARVAYQLPALGNINVSYMIEGIRVAAGFGLKADSDEMVPTAADAEVYDHLFGVYGSLHLGANTDLTIGYNGALTGYLPEFYNASAKGMVETGYPLVSKNGFNVNARFKLHPVTLRTDNSLTFWIDKDYRLFESNNSSPDWTSDRGLQQKSIADKYSEIVHFVIWDGIGANYPLSDKISLDGYLRNLFSLYNAEGTGPGGSGKYTLIRDEATFDVGVNLRFNANIEAFIKLGFTYLATYRSEDLNRQSTGYFIDYIDNSPSKGKPVPVETLDHSFAFRIPIGIRVKY